MVDEAGDRAAELVFLRDRPLVIVFVVVGVGDGRPDAARPDDLGHGGVIHADRGHAARHRLGDAKAEALGGCGGVDVERVVERAQHRARQTRTIRDDDPRATSLAHLADAIGQEATLVEG